MYNYI